VEGKSLGVFLVLSLHSAGRTAESDGFPIRIIYEPIKVSTKNLPNTIRKGYTYSVKYYKATLAYFKTLTEYCSRKLSLIHVNVGTAVAQWLRCCGTNRKFAGSIQDGVIGSFH
jgi:hypothetical protein